MAGRRGAGHVRSGASREIEAGGMEQEMLLTDEEHADENSGISLQWTSDEPTSHPGLPVYNTTHQIRRRIIASVNDAYTIEQLTDPSMITSTVQPLVEDFYVAHDVTIVYCLLINRVEFLQEQSTYARDKGVNITRATLCDMVATKVLQRADDANPGAEGLLLLAKILVEHYDPFQNASAEVVQENIDTFGWDFNSKDRNRRTSMALELAIISESKNFLSSPACQKLVAAIHIGRIIYTPSSPIDILPDHYKYRPIALYEPRKAPLLNQYRLIVPRTRNILEVCQFAVLLLLYLLVMGNRDSVRFTGYELVFCAYAFGWALDQFASILEHGWQLYTRNLWSFLDVAFAIIYAIYLILRICSIATGDVGLSQLALEILYTGAPVLVPRLAFNIMSENMLFVSLRAMMADFAVLCLLAVWCSAGFLLAMAWLSNGMYQATTISKWMLWVWFGLDGTGIERSVDLHRVLGPILMIAFAFLGNTLFLTILVAMLSNTFSVIVSNVAVENQYRHAILTFGGVKSDAIFAYQPPFNILALCLMLPLKLVLSPRWFHRVNVAAVRVLNAPLLLVICLYERKYLWAESSRKGLRPSKTRSKLALWTFSKFPIRDVVQAVFKSVASQPMESIPKETKRVKRVDVEMVDEGCSQMDNKYQASSSSRLDRRSRSRLFSIESSAALEEDLHNISQHVDDRKCNKDRIEALEASNKRIEIMLHRMCEALGQTTGVGDIDLKTSFDQWAREESTTKARE